MYTAGKKILMLIKTQINVALQKTKVTNWLLVSVMLTAKNEKVVFLKFPDKFNIWQFSVHIIDKIA